MNNSVEERQRERFISKSTGVCAKYLRRMLELKGAPNNLKFFTDILDSVYIKLQDVDKGKSTHTIGTYCVMVPQELVYAAGAVPVKLCCGGYTAFNIGDDLSPRDACPLVKAVVGATNINAMPIYDNCEMMVVPTTCDCKKKLASQLQEYKPTITLHVPSSKEKDEDLEFYVEDLYRFRDLLEEITGKKITYRKLMKSINMISGVQYELSRFYELKKTNPSLIRGTHAMAIMNSYSYCHAQKWGNALKLLNDELEMNLKNQNFVGRMKQPRIMVTGSPIVFPNIKVPLLIEEMGGIVVADETCMGERGLYDPVAVVDQSFDGLMRSLAKRYILPCSCPTFVNNEQRIFKIKQMVEDFKVEGIVYHVLRGCLVYDYEYAMLEEEMAKIGIPIIRLESDYNEEDIEQLRIRIEAFIEMIKFGNMREDKVPAANNVQQNNQMPDLSTAEKIEKFRFNNSNMQANNYMAPNNPDQFQFNSQYASPGNYQAAIPKQLYAEGDNRNMLPDRMANNQMNMLPDGNMQNMNNEQNNYGNMQNMNNEQNNYGNMQNMNNEQNNYGNMQNMNNEQNNYGNMQNINNEQNNYGNMQNMNNGQSNYGNMQNMNNGQNNYGNKQNMDSDIKNNDTQNLGNTQRLRNTQNLYNTQEIQYDSRNNENMDNQYNQMQNENTDNQYNGMQNDNMDNQYNGMQNDNMNNRYNGIQNNNMNNQYNQMQNDNMNNRYNRM